MFSARNSPDRGRANGDQTRHTYSTSHLYITNPDNRRHSSTTHQQTSAPDTATAPKQESQGPKSSLRDRAFETKANLQTLIDFWEAKRQMAQSHMDFWEKQLKSDAFAFGYNMAKYTAMTDADSAWKAFEPIEEAAAAEVQRRMPKEPRNSDDTTAQGHG